MKNQNISKANNAVLYKTGATVILLAVILLIACTSQSCYDDHGWTRTQTYYKITVDSIYFPNANPSTQDTLYIKFFGPIGDDSCYTFSYFQESGTANQTDIALWGMHDYIPASPSDGCTKANMQLKGLMYKLYPVKPGLHTVNVHEPSGNLLSRQIFVH